MTNDDNTLGDLRQQIDAVDSELVRLLNQRAKLVQSVGERKIESGISTYKPDRERMVLDNIQKLNDGPLPDRTLAAIWRELMSGSFALERPPRIAYLGPEGSYSHCAAVGKFGSTVEYSPMRNIDAVFDEVARERVDLAVVPFENTSGGGVIDTLDAFGRHDVRICAEINVAIHHHLLGNIPLEKIQRVYSKPEVFSQCWKWLLETGLADKTIASESSSAAARQAAGEENAAAIGSELAAEVYGLSVIRDRIEDDAGNVTRFVVVGHAPAAPTGRDKTCIRFQTADKPGALVDVLDVFRKAELNMTFIESRPARTQKWSYVFMVDFEGHASEPNVQDALKEVESHCRELKTLGSFPRAEETI